MSKPTFDLLTAPWIPVRDLTGGERSVGLRAALADAHQLAELRDPSPLVTAALHRLLLAILQRALGKLVRDEDWLAHWERGAWDGPAVMDYLERCRDRFDLFHPKRPFLQVPALGVPSLRWVPVTTLGLEFAGGNNDTLFDHHHEQAPVAWPPDRVARYLVTTQAFALGGGKSSDSQRFGTHPYRSHGPCVGRVLILAHGSNLFETLALNLVSSPNNRLAPDAKIADDKPFWELEPDELVPPGARAIRGVADYLTWSSRALLLHPNEDLSVAQLEFTSLHALPERELGWRDPLSLHKEAADGGVLPVALRADRALWRDSSELVSPVDDYLPENLLRLRRLDEPDLSLVRAHAFGLASDKAKPLGWRHDEFALPRALLRDPDVRVIFDDGRAEVQRVADVLQRALRRLAERLLAIGGGQAPRGEEVRRFVDRMGGMPRYWAQVESAFRLFVRGLGATDPEPALEDLGRAVQRTAMHVFERSSDGCLGGGAPPPPPTPEASSVMSRHLRRGRAAVQPEGKVSGE